MLCCAALFLAASSLISSCASSTTRLTACRRERQTVISRSRPALLAAKHLRSWPAVTTAPRVALRVGTSLLSLVEVPMLMARLMPSTLASTVIYYSGILAFQNSALAIYFGKNLILFAIDHATLTRPDRIGCAFAGKGHAGRCQGFHARVGRVAGSVGHALCRLHGADYGTGHRQGQPLCLNSRSIERILGGQSCLMADELSYVRRTEPLARSSTVKSPPRSGPINRGPAAPDSWGG